MNKSLVKILIGLFVIVGLLPASFVFANGLLDIDFEEDPLFQEANFLPGQSVTRYIEVENKSSEVQPIGVEVIDYSSCTVDCFSEQLELTISDGSADIYTASLDQFFNAGDIKLSDLAAGDTIKYYFTVTFLPDSGNQYQEKTVNFDFKIGSLGKESIGGEIGGGETGNGGTGGGGGFFITGLNIFEEEAVSGTEENQAVIKWKTNKPATSRVIYSSENHKPDSLLLDSSPNYGYNSSTVEDSALKTVHSMTISGLEPETTYYFRCVSRGSLAISKELSFTTSKTGDGKIVFEPIDFELPSGPDTPSSPDSPSSISGIYGQGTEEEGVDSEDELLLEEDESIDEEEEEESGNMFLAAISQFLNSDNFCWILFLIIIILLALVFLSEKKIKGKKKWIPPIAIVAAIILYYFFCGLLYWILVLAAIVLFAYSFVKNRKNKKDNIS